MEISLRSKQKKQKDISPISIRKLTPIQMPHIDIDELKAGAEQLLRKMNGWIFFFVLSAWSRMNLHTVRNGCS